MEFRVSVIIPVFNAEQFIEKAIKSAVDQSQVSEVVIVDDGSTDNTESILKKLVAKYKKLKVYYHNDKSNKGRSASRNLGIRKAKENYIGFLDADDFYLPNRFLNDKKIFERNSKIDGIYNAIGVHFYRKATKEEEHRLQLTTITKKVGPDKLFMTLLKGNNGHFSIDGLTIKKGVFERIGYFVESLEVMEDTELFFRMSLKSHLISGILDKPLAMRGVHDANVFNTKEVYEKYRIKMYKSLLFWCSKNQIPLQVADEILSLIWLHKFKESSSLLINIKYWKHLFFNNHRLLYSILSVKYFPIIRLRKKLFPLLYK